MLFILVTKFFGTTLNFAAEANTSFPSPSRRPCCFTWDLLEAERENHPEMSGSKTGVP